MLMQNLFDQGSLFHNSKSSLFRFIPHYTPEESINMVNYLDKLLFKVNRYGKLLSLQD